MDGGAGQVDGFSLHAGVVAEANESEKSEKLCRYIARPAIRETRLSIPPQGGVRYQLKIPWKSGTTHIDLEPVEFIAKLAALVPPPRAHLPRFHGAFAPYPSGRGKRPMSDEASPGAEADHRSPEEKRRAMTWAQRLRRVFGIEVTTWLHCGGAVRSVANIEEP